MDKLTLNYKESWDTRYRGVRIEIVHWRLGWNYYLLIPTEQLPDEVNDIFNLKPGKSRLTPESRDFISFDYISAPIISDLDWHGGITFYEKKFDGFGELTGYKLGCDFMHLWDENIEYDIDYVKMEAFASINKLWELVPNLKVSCSWNGKYYDLADMVELKRGDYVAKENAHNYEPELFSEVK